MVDLVPHLLLQEILLDMPVVEVGVFGVPELMAQQHQVVVLVEQQ